MQLTFNGVEPHRVFYNDELVKKIYMNDKLVYAYYPSFIIYLPHHNSDYVNEIDHHTSDWCLSYYIPNDGFYAQAAFLDKFHWEAPVDGTYRITFELEDLAPYVYKGYMDIMLYEGERVEFESEVSTICSMGEWLYHRSIVEKNHSEYGTISAKLDVIRFYRSASDRQGKSEVATCSAVVSASVGQLYLFHEKGGLSTPLQFNINGGGGMHNIIVPKTYYDGAVTPRDYTGNLLPHNGQITINRIR